MPKGLLNAVDFLFKFYLLGKLFKFYKIGIVGPLVELAIFLVRVIELYTLLNENTVCTPVVGEAVIERESE